MTWWQAVILGLVEGLTEYLPVSSTGHLILAQRLMGIEGGEAADAYAICIQAGAIVAVLGLYRRRVMEMVLGLIWRVPPGRRIFMNLVTAFVPAMVFGLTLNKPIKAHLFGLWPVVWAWLVGGLAILAVTWWKGRRSKAANGLQEGSSLQYGHTVESMTWKMALVIGLAQCLAMWPGTSRSLVTIVAGVCIGMRLASAVEFSFLLGVMTLGAATCYDGIRHGDAMVETYGLFPLLIGFVFAYVSAVLAIQWMVGYLNRHGMAIFGWYRVILAIIVGALLLLGWVTA